jgi:AGZA family xanthine/uracil permease-like MFS transporter
VKFSAFFIVLGMPLTYSITNGLLLGALVFSFVKIVEGKYREIGMAMSILAVVALLVFLYSDIILLHQVKIFT